MTTAWYIFCACLVIFGFLGFIATLARMINQGKKELLEQMFKAGDINESVYKKYL